MNKKTLKDLKKGKIGFCPECGDFIGITKKCGECIEFRDKINKGSRR